MIVGRQISQRLTTRSHGVLTVSHDMANAFPSVDQDAIAGDSFLHRREC